MKVPGLLLTALLLVHSATYPQKIPKHGQCKDCDQQVIVLNPVGEDGVVRTCLPYGIMVKFKITNVNPFKLDGATSVVKNPIDFSIPSQFSAASAMPEQTKTKAASTSDPIMASAAPDKKNHAYDKEKLESHRAAEPDHRSAFILNYNAFIKTLNQLALYTSIEDHLDSLIKDDYIADTTVFRSNLREYMTSINDEDTNAHAIRRKCLAALEQLTVSYINAKNAYEQLNPTVKTDNVKLSGQLASADKKAQLKIDSAQGTIISQNEFEKEYQFITAKFDIIHPEKKRAEIINKANAGIDLYTKIKNQPFVVYTDAQQLDDDIVTITPKLKNKKGEVIKEFNPVKIKTYGGIKVNFSSGYLLSFKGDDNYTNLYDANGETGVQKSSTDNLRHSVGALVNVYPRSCKAVTFGGSVGLSIPTDGTRIGFYGGLSALMFEKNRLVMTTGISYIKTKMLNTANLTVAPAKEGKPTYTFSNSEYKQIIFDELYRPAFSIGITYNIFSLKN